MAKYKQVVIRVTEKELEWLHKEARGVETSMSSMIRLSIGLPATPGGGTAMPPMNDQQRLIQSKNGKVGRNVEAKE
jgi:hypothetical protein